MPCAYFGRDQIRTQVDASLFAPCPPSPSQRKLGDLFLLVAQYDTMQCNAMQYNAIQYNTIQYNTEALYFTTLATHCYCMLRLCCCCVAGLLLVCSCSVTAFFLFYLTNRFHVAVRLFSNRSHVTSKCGKNKSLAHGAIPE